MYTVETMRVMMETMETMDAMENYGDNVKLWKQRETME